MTDDVADTLYGLEDRRKHLDLEQAVIARMASASSTAKSWLLPVVIAAYGYALAQHSWTVAALGIAGAVVFAVLDAHYLRLERAFRALFRATAAGQITGYDMNARRYLGKPNGDEDDLREEDCRWPAVIWSWSLAGFYGPIAAVGLAAAVSSALAGHS